MSNSLRQKARELQPAIRAALEAELGRTFADDESVNISVYPPYVEPSPEARREASERLRKHFAKVDARGIPGTDQEIEADVIEAMRSVRPGYREIE
jgi:hypothetical protein